VARLAAPLVAEGGSSACVPARTPPICEGSAPPAHSRHRAGGPRGQLIHTGFAGPDHPQLPHLAETGYLKALFFRL
jgi:23S rRNA (cytosine1962-C5)-methyltransferase